MIIIVIIIIIIIIIIKTAIKNFSIIVSMFRIGTEKGHFERYVTIYRPQTQYISEIVFENSNILV